MKRLRLKVPTKRSINIITRVFLGVGLFVLLFSIVHLSTGPSVVQLYEGDISLKDIYAPYDFNYTGDINESRMRQAEEAALKEARPVYRIDAQVEKDVVDSIKSFFGHVRGSQDVKELVGDDQKLKNLRVASNIRLTDQTYLRLIRAADIDYIEKVLLKVVNQSLEGGISSDNLKGSNEKEVIVSDPSKDIERKTKIDDIPTLEEFKAGIEKSLAEYFPKDKKLRADASEIIKSLISPNLQFDPDLTERYKREILTKVPKIYEEIAVKKNELLLGRGEKVTKKHLKMLVHLGKTRAIQGRPFYLVGMALMLIIFLILSVFHLRFYETKIFQDNKNLFLLSLLVIFIAVVAEAVVISPLSSYLIPLASASMLIAILLDANSAFIFTVVMSIFVGVVGGSSFGLMVVMLVGGSIGIYSVRKVRRRSKLLLAGLLVGAANLLTITSINLLNNLSPRIFFREGLVGIGNGLASFLLVIGLLPVLEYIFKIPTEITLLELSDLNHPLLKEMATKAPGTYHHSLIVGNLAEAACDSINANSLLARIGAYYHDIGKIEKTEYFSENEPRANSRHGNLTPTMSALVIINHVKDGIDAARRHKLNQALIDFIAQHHGNGLIYYFFQRALEKAEDEKSIKEEDFRYPGPRPQTKETAIVLLADSVEASSRTLTNPTPSRVEDLVQRIINNKFIDGQLDECNLTLKDLHKISEAFTRLLNAMFHTRVEYPNEEEIQRTRAHRNNHRKSDQRSNPNGSLNKKNNKGNA